MKLKSMIGGFLVALLTITAVGPLPVRADEGMWTFNNVPKA